MINKARSDTNDPARGEDLGRDIEPSLLLLIEEAHEAGYGTDEVLEAMAKVLARLRHGQEEDPDPAEDDGLETAEVGSATAGP